MPPTLEKKARTQLRQLKEQADRAGLLLEELAVVLGTDAGTIRRHLAGERIPTTRSRQYIAIANLLISHGAVHLVVKRRGNFRKDAAVKPDLDAEKRRAIELLDRARDRNP